MSGHAIKRAVTIYSWHRQVEAGKLTWDDCVRAAVKMGCNGIELLGQLYFRYCPEALQEDIDSWNAMMWKYGTKLIAHDFFVDRTLYAHRSLTIRESVDIVRRHAEFSKRVGCPVMRVGGTVDPEVFRQSVPILESLGVKMGLEIHNGSSSFCLPQVQKVIEVIRKSNSPSIGIVPDMSMFVMEVSPRQLRSAIANGVDEGFVQEVAARYKQVSNEEFRAWCNAKMEEAKGKDNVRSFLAMVRRTEYWDPRVLLEHMPYILHCHGKFYEMDDRNEETTIDYPNILKVLAEGGYQGYIAAEYEGAPIDGDTFEPFRRYQKMLDKYLGTYPDANFPEWPNAEPVVGAGFGQPQQAMRPTGFRNHYDNGVCTGFELEVSNYYYRGVPLSLFESCYVEIDGRRFGPESMRVEVDGETFKFADMCDVTLHYWNKGLPAKIIVDLPGGLVVGREYDASAVVSVRAYYMREGIAAQLGDVAVRMPPAVKRTLEA